MTTPTRDEILRAHKSLTNLCNLVEIRAGYRPDEYERVIRAALPPKPLPTMADVEWDGDKHYLAEAEVGEIKLVMLGPDLAGWIRGFNPETGKIMPAADPEATTPTGRRYTLTEVQE